MGIWLTAHFGFDCLYATKGNKGMEIKMKRIVLHWTAGTHNVSKIDRKHYHYIVAGDGSVVAGDMPPEANESTKTPYAAHTRGLNTGSIGVSMAAMHGAKERPFNPGKYPITAKQLAGAVKLLSQLAAKYSIPIEGQTILTHAEVQPVLGVKQSGKWDICWLPGMATTGDPVKVGDNIRQMVRDYSPAKPKPVAAKPTPSIWAAIWAALLSFRKG